MSKVTIFILCFTILIGHLNAKNSDDILLPITDTISTTTKTQHIIKGLGYPIYLVFETGIGGMGFYEHSIGNKHSINLGIKWQKTWNVMINQNFRTIAAMLEWRFYFQPNNKKLTGFYISPYIKYRNLLAAEIYSNDTLFEGKDVMVNSFGGGLMIGTQWIGKKKETRVRNFFIGIGYFPYEHSVIKGTKTSYQVIKPIDFRIGFAIGKKL